MSLLKNMVFAVAVGGLLAAGEAGAAQPALSAPSASSLVVDSAMIVKVSGGCGPNGWRGPWGHCRNTPYHGRLPDGGWK